MLYRCSREDCGNINRDETPTLCPKCKDRYCSLSCREQDKSEHKCIQSTSEIVSDTLAFYFGYTQTHLLNLPKVAGEIVVGIPGPISGKIPKRIISIRDNDVAKLLSEYEKQILSSTTYYYIFPMADTHKVWMHELTKEQKLEIKMKI